MGRPGKELARRTSTAITGPQVVYSAAEHEAQYVVSHTGLGEFALHWNAQWLSGLFCVSDFPAEWVAFVQAAFCGGWREAVHDLGERRPFSGVAWDLSAWERAVGPFSHVVAQAWLPRDPVWGMVEQDAKAVRRGEIPWVRSLALPGTGEATVE
jgi:hypothetical protein